MKLVLKKLLKNSAFLSFDFDIDSGSMLQELQGFQPNPALPVGGGCLGRSLTQGAATDTNRRSRKFRNVREIHESISDVEQRLKEKNYSVRTKDGMCSSPLLARRPSLKSPSMENIDHTPKPLPSIPNPPPHSLSNSPSLPVVFLFN